MPHEARFVTSVEIRDLAAFDDLRIELSPGVNAVIGEAGVGKSFLLQAIYAAVTAREGFPARYDGLFHPQDRPEGWGVLAGSRDPALAVSAGELRSVALGAGAGAGDGILNGRQAVFIPTTDVLRQGGTATADGLGVDAELRALLGRQFAPRKSVGRLSELLADLESELGGHPEPFGKAPGLVFRTEDGDRPLASLSEGQRRLAALWLLMRTGAVSADGFLIWDQPETGLSPKAVGAVVQALLGLQRVGCQVVLATHSYVLLKELSLLAKSGDRVRYHSLRRDPKTGTPTSVWTDDYDLLEPNDILQAYGSIYDRSVRQAMRSDRW